MTHRDPIRSTFRRAAALFALSVPLLIPAGCGEDPLGPDPGLAPLVGDWEAVSLVLSSPINPDVAPDIIELGAEFTLNVQPSGQYTAILVFALQAQTEIGRMSVSGSTLTLEPDFPPGQPMTTGVFAVTESGWTLDGPTEFDFNLDGEPEAADAHFEFVRR